MGHFWFSLGKMRENLMTNVGEHDEGSRSVESDSETDVEHNPTTFLNHKIDNYVPHLIVFTHCI